MSTLLYGNITGKREAASPASGLGFNLSMPGRTYSLVQPMPDHPGTLTLEEETPAPERKTSKWVDMAAALVPAEVLAIATVAVQIQTSEDNEGNATFTAEPSVLAIQFFILLLLPALLFVLGRGFQEPKWGGWDVARAAIPCFAFAMWSVLQPTSLWEAVETQFGFAVTPGLEFVIAAAAVVVLGAASTALSAKADQQPN